tara:strand:+ start:269 stop:478 length:210 start_codon:yes stop_codon:yes gene_type:complete
MSETTENIFSGIAGVFLIPWVGGMTVAVPWFNYQYAVNNGFISWLIFGEIVATFQAFIWPFYLLDYLFG